MGAEQTANKSASGPADLLGSVEWRCIGPHRGGRVIAVAGDPSDAQTFYFGACGGGVWKTEDNGIHWHPISDGYFATGSIGAIRGRQNGTVTVKSWIGSLMTGPPLTVALPRRVPGS